VAKKQTAKQLKPDNGLRSPCPVAAALDVLGDRWTLLVLRDLFWGKRRYSEFLTSPEGIPTNILAERLVRLENSGLLSAAPYQSNPPRFEYQITPKGRELLPTLLALAQWGEKHFPGTKAQHQAPP
jgi:DNA-binding HxlR family transcriptional regulator